MKKPFYIPILLILTLIMFHSCTKEETIKSETSIEQQIDDMYNTFLMIQKSKPNVTMRLSVKNNKVVSLLEVPSNIIAFRANYISDAEPVCEGEGLTFVNCVKKILKAGKCVIITSCVNYCAYITDCP